MIRPGEVEAVRELTKGAHRVQARVCLGSDVKRGSAIITIEASSPAVMAALALLHHELRMEASRLVAGVLEGQREWDEGRSA